VRELKLSISQAMPRKKAISKREPEVRIRNPHEKGEVLQWHFSMLQHYEGQD
jgi:hypothetical protein